MKVKTREKVVTNKPSIVRNSKVSSTSSNSKKLNPTYSSTNNMNKNINSNLKNTKNQKIKKEKENISVVGGGWIPTNSSLERLKKINAISEDERKSNLYSNALSQTMRGNENMMMPSQKQSNLSSNNQIDNDVLNNVSYFSNIIFSPEDAKKRKENKEKTNSSNTSKVKFYFSQQRNEEEKEENPIMKENYKDCHIKVCQPKSISKFKSMSCRNEDSIEDSDRFNKDKNFILNSKSTKIPNNKSQLKLVNKKTKLSDYIQTENPENDEVGKEGMHGSTGVGGKYIPPFSNSKTSITNPNMFLNTSYSNIIRNKQEGNELQELGLDENENSAEEFYQNLYYEYYQTDRRIVKEVLGEDKITVNQESKKRKWKPEGGVRNNTMRELHKPKQAMEMTLSKLKNVNCDYNEYDYDEILDITGGKNPIPEFSKLQKNTKQGLDYSVEIDKSKSNTLHMNILNTQSEYRKDNTILEADEEGEGAYNSNKKHTISPSCTSSLNSEERLKRERREMIKAQVNRNITEYKKSVKSNSLLNQLNPVKVGSLKHSKVKSSQGSFKNYLENTKSPNTELSTSKNHSQNYNNTFNSFFNVNEYIGSADLSRFVIKEEKERKEEGSESSKIKHQSSDEKIDRVQGQGEVGGGFISKFSSKSKFSSITNFFPNNKPTNISSNNSKIRQEKPGYNNFSYNEKTKNNFNMKNLNKNTTNAYKEKSKYNHYNQLFINKNASNSSFNAFNQNQLNPRSYSTNENNSYSNGNQLNNMNRMMSDNSYIAYADFFSTSNNNKYGFSGYSKKLNTTTISSSNKKVDKKATKDYSSRYLIINDFPSNNYNTNNTVIYMKNDSNKSYNLSEKIRVKSNKEYSFSYRRLPSTTTYNNQTVSNSNLLSLKKLLGEKNKKEISNLEERIREINKEKYLLQSPISNEFNKTNFQDSAKKNLLNHSINYNKNNIEFLNKNEEERKKELKKEEEEEETVEFKVKDKEREEDIKKRIANSVKPPTYSLNSKSNSKSIINTKKPFIPSKPLQMHEISVLQNEESSYYNTINPNLSMFIHLNENTLLEQSEHCKCKKIENWKEEVEKIIKKEKDDIASRAKSNKNYDFKYIRKYYKDFDYLLKDSKQSHLIALKKKFETKNQYSIRLKKSLSEEEGKERREDAVVDSEANVFITKSNEEVYNNLNINFDLADETGRVSKAGKQEKQDNLETTNPTKPPQVNLQHLQSNNNIHTLTQIQKENNITDTTLIPKVIVNFNTENLVRKKNYFISSCRKAMNTTTNHVEKEAVSAAKDTEPPKPTHTILHKAYTTTNNNNNEDRFTTTPLIQMNNNTNPNKSEIILNKERKNFKITIMKDEEELSNSNSNSNSNVHNITNSLPQNTIKDKDKSFYSHLVENTNYEKINKMNEELLKNLKDNYNYNQETKNTKKTKTSLSKSNNLNCNYNKSQVTNIDINFDNENHNFYTTRYNELNDEENLSYRGNKKEKRVVETKEEKEREKDLRDFKSNSLRKDGKDGKDEASKKYEKYNKQKISYEAYKEFSHNKINPNTKFLERMKFYEIKKQVKNEKIENEVKKQIPKISEKHSLSVFNKLLDDYNKRETVKKYIEENYLSVVNSISGREVFKFKDRNIEKSKERQLSQNQKMDRLFSPNSLRELSILQDSRREKKDVVDGVVDLETGLNINEVNDLNQDGENFACEVNDLNEVNKTINTNNRPIKTETNEELLEEMKDVVDSNFFDEPKLILENNRREEGNEEIAENEENNNAYLNLQQDSQKIQGGVSTQNSKLHDSHFEEYYKRIIEKRRKFEEEKERKFQELEEKKKEAEEAEIQECLKHNRKVDKETAERIFSRLSSSTTRSSQVKKILKEKDKEKDDNIKSDSITKKPIPSNKVKSDKKISSCIKEEEEESIEAKRVESNTKIIKNVPEKIKMNIKEINSISKNQKKEKPEKEREHEKNSIKEIKERKANDSLNKNKNNNTKNRNHTSRKNEKEEEPNPKFNVIKYQGNTQNMPSTKNKITDKIINNTNKLNEREGNINNTNMINKPTKPPSIQMKNKIKKTKSTNYFTNYNSRMNEEIASTTNKENSDSMRENDVYSFLNINKPTTHNSNYNIFKKTKTKPKMNTKNTTYCKDELLLLHKSQKMNFSTESEHAVFQGLLEDSHGQAHGNIKEENNETSNTTSSKIKNMKNALSNSNTNTNMMKYKTKNEFSGISGLGGGNQTNILTKITKINTKNKLTRKETKVNKSISEKQIDYLLNSLFSFGVDREGEERERETNLFK